jgi:3'-5' exoribonuclease
MDGLEVVGIKLSELASLEAGSEAVCFAALAEKSKRTTKYGSPYWKCVFQDRYGHRDFMIWADDPLLEAVEGWGDGLVFRLLVRAKTGQRGIELKILQARRATPEDAGVGFAPADLYEVSRFSADECLESLRKTARENIKDQALLAVVDLVFRENEAALRKMPAARAMHHAFTGGLLEHMRSMAGLCAYLARHYGKYYDELDPPLNKDIIVAAGILHDIGKLAELEYHPVAARYTTVGHLVGHIVIGRDMVRKAAETVGNVPEETLLQLEHAILAHHGKLEFASPVLPQTIEAMIVSFADDIDAKIHQAVRTRVRSKTDDPFSEDVFLGPERRRIYKGQPDSPPAMSDGQALGPGQAPETV